MCLSKCLLHGVIISASVISNVAYSRRLLLCVKKKNFLCVSPVNYFPISLKWSHLVFDIITQGRSFWLSTLPMPILIVYSSIGQLPVSDAPAKTSQQLIYSNTVNILAIPSLPRPNLSHPSCCAVTRTAYGYFQYSKCSFHKHLYSCNMTFPLLYLMPQLMKACHMPSLLLYPLVLP